MCINQNLHSSFHIRHQPPQILYRITYDPLVPFTILFDLFTRLSSHIPQPSMQAVLQPAQSAQDLDQPRQF